MSAGSKFPIDSFGKLVDSCVAFYKKNENEMSLERIRENRAELSVFVESFHRDCGTLTPSVQEKIKCLKEGAGLVLMTAHQPNLFAYSGVYRKATLNFVLARKLENLLEIPVVNFFGIADQDFTDDRWARSFQLPAIQRSEGILSIHAKLPETLMLNRAARPSPDTLEKWKAEIKKWVVDATKSVEMFLKKQGVERDYCGSYAATFQENFESFWNIVTDCHERSKTYSDFSAFAMSKIVNDLWGYDTVFSRFSECQQILSDGFSFLLSHFMEYSRLLSEATKLSHGEGCHNGVSNEEPFLVPFWYHCSCGSKVKLYLAEEDRTLFGNGSCIGCRKSYELELGPQNDPQVSHISARISARAIPMSLVFFNGLIPSSYVGGVAGISYLTEAQHVAEGLGIPFPPIAVWRPHDRYLGIGQVEAKIELRQLCKEFSAPDVSTASDFLKSRISGIRGRLDKLEASKKSLAEKLGDRPNDEKLIEKMRKISIRQTEINRSSNLSVLARKLQVLENASVVLDLMPSIIDYAVNVGLRKTSDQWIEHLGKNTNLSADVPLESVLDGIAELKPVLRCLN